MTAFQVLHFVADIESVKPEFVLIHAGASSVGLAAIQIANAQGCKVIVTCGSKVRIRNTDIEMDGILLLI